MIPSDNDLASSAGSTNVKSQSTTPSRAKRSRLGLKVGLVGLGIVLILGAWGAVLTHQVLSVRSHMEQAIDLVPQLVSEIGKGNRVEANVTVESIHVHTSAARSRTTSPLWQSAASIPFIGPNFSAVQEVATSSEDIMTRAVMPLVDNYDALNWQTISPENGRIDITKLREAAPDISTAAYTVRLSYQRLASIDRTFLFPQIGEPLESVTVQLEELAVVLDTASSVAELLPALLGADEPRNYLVLIQNSAEVRATGGIPGALAILQAEDGHMTLGEQSSAVALGTFRPSLHVDPEQVSLYTSRLGTQMQNVNLTPNFPTAAATAKQMWEQRHADQKIDGVLALDPMVLSYLLEATGPVNLTDPLVLKQIEATDLPFSLTKENVVPTLLSEVYRQIEDPEAQDAYFAAVASRVFSVFTDGQGDNNQLVSALARSAEERRLYLWSSHSNEQDIIGSTPLQGAVTAPDLGGASFGVYFNDGTGAKMDYYAERTVQLLRTCSSDDSRDYMVRVTVTNNAPDNAALALPAYVTGNRVFGVEPGRIRTNYVVYGPAQAFVETAEVDGESVTIGSGKHGQRPVGSVQVELGPGETKVIEVHFSKVTQKSEPTIHVTPSIQAPEDVILPPLDEGC